MIVYVNYNGGRFSMQTPWMTMPWAMSCFSEGPYPKYSCELSFRGMDENQDISMFHDKLLEMENKHERQFLEGDAPGSFDLCFRFRTCKSLQLLFCEIEFDCVVESLYVFRLDIELESEEGLERGGLFDTGL